MIEALHSPGVLYGRATATILHRVSSPASLLPQSLPVAFQAKAVGGSLNSKINFLHFCSEQLSSESFLSEQEGMQAQHIWRSNKTLLFKKKKQQLFELDTHFWQQFRQVCWTSLIFEC